MIEVPAYFGSKLVSGNFLVDTTSAFTAINSVSCSKCEKAPYDPTASSTSAFKFSFTNRTVRISILIVRMGISK
jgi:hypothetical protein